MRRASVSERANLYRKEQRREAIVWQRAQRRDSADDHPPDPQLPHRVTVSHRHRVFPSPHGGTAFSVPPR